jgi:hypothetical protein
MLIPQFSVRVAFQDVYQDSISNAASGWSPESILDIGNVKFISMLHLSSLRSSSRKPDVYLK